MNGHTPYILYYENIHYTRTSTAVNEPWLNAHHPSTTTTTTTTTTSPDLCRACLQHT
jgi:hypothetical protein